MGVPFILIPGRSTRQGTSLNQGKSSALYRQETETVYFCAEDLARLGLRPGARVRLTSGAGACELTAAAAAKDEVPPGVLFLAYGPPVCALIGGETHASGMPDSKAIDVGVEPVPPPADRPAGRA